MTLEELLRQMPTEAEIHYFRFDCHYLATDADLEQWRTGATWWQAQILDAECAARREADAGDD